MSPLSGDTVRTTLKQGLARTAGRRPGAGATVLIYHRVGGGTRDELDLPADRFAAQLDTIPDGRVVPLDTALDRLESDDRTPSVVLTFDDGFADVYANAWPLLRDRRLPFTLYLATGMVGDTMRWEGSTGTSAGSPALTWEQLAEMQDSGLLTIGNHTRSHARPEDLTEAELDAASEDIDKHLGVRPDHFAYTWGVPVPAMEHALRCRFRSAATGALGRNLPGDDPIRLRRVPVRRTDPTRFFAAKLTGALGPERAYARVVALGKKAGAHA
ncbi:polysaccharide deacetylase family protein [Yinghuangia seranimata]|uniref:polysaccharide deacetylase family protein n=1 Tax=Yinghuangia seranimata TaxID=408067 RepID=UPI00248AC43B|nr:polysaccharide deacetylase family protein [Yinghuangia seranimata]MDI2130216.1 polysaccharide deacetylase family protein [Yinghuangia seranimata]